MNCSDNKWKEIWEKRTENLVAVDRKNPIDVFVELKRIDGFDVIGGGIPQEALIQQHNAIKRRLSGYKHIRSCFEVGCGCGADLYLFSIDGLKIGGMDYSETQIKIANKVFSDSKNLQELICDEAINLPTDIQYDSVLSNSVFSYFPDEEYAVTVLDRMREKSKYCIGLVDIHDIEKKEQFEIYRRATVENYDERYKDLKKLFYHKEFFEEWADRNEYNLEFFDSNVDGYWNSNFVFDVYFYKR